MAYVPDVSVVNYKKWKISPAAVIAYQFYCARRNDETGGWECDDQWVANETGYSRNRIAEARIELESKGWIKIMYQRGTRYFIAPFFGFFVENSTENHENSTKSVENSTRSLKELPALLPAQFTREGADESAPHAQPDKKSKSQSAGKPALIAAPTKTRKRKSSAPRPPAKRKLTDTTINHPAVQMVKEITGRFPRKEFWKQIAEEIGDEPDIDFFRRSYVKWRGFRGHPETYNKWLFDPNKTGNLPETYGANGNGKGKPPDVQKFDPKRPLDEKDRREALEILFEIRMDGGDISQWENNYAPDDWAWLMENLKNA